MKKVAFVLSLLFIGGAVADSAPTSVGYVDSQIGTLQNKISAVDTNTVLTTTNTAGEIGQKSIYDATGNYAEQQNALVTAEVANAAVQNAIDTEFVCIEWDSAADGCLIYQVTSAHESDLPSGYTQLQYLESTGTQWIDSGVRPTQNTGVLIKYSFLAFAKSKYIFGTYSPSSPHYYLGINSQGSAMVAAYGPNSGNVVIKLDIQDVQIGAPYVMNLNYNNSGVVEFVGIQKVNMTEKTFSASTSMRVFGNSADVGYSATARIYYMKITEGQTLVRDFVPVIRNSDGKPGLYDFVSETFFTNSGSGEFIPGAYLTTGN